MLRKLKNKRGEGYVDVCVGIVVFVMMLVVFINILNIVKLRVDMNSAADVLMDIATSTGEFGDEFWSTSEELCEKYNIAGIWGTADAMIDGGRVQLGVKMKMGIAMHTNIKGIGIFEIPITISVEKHGLSEKYWK